MIYSKWWFSGLLMLPSYVVAGLVSSQFSGGVWILILLFFIGLIGFFYSKVMIDRIGPLQSIDRKSIAIVLVVFQFLGLAAIVLSIG